MIRPPPEPLIGLDSVPAAAGAMARCDALLAEYRARAGQGRILANSLEALRVELTYHSNAIEGSTLSLRETQLVIEGHAPTSGKTMRELYEARNHDRALRLIESWAGSRDEDRLTEQDLLAVHGVVLADIAPDSAGRFRTERVLTKGSRFIPPGSHRFGELVPVLLAQGARAGAHPLLRAAEIHDNLAAVHPFADGNGRTARLLMNFVLLRHGHPPTIIEVGERAEYLASLEEANAGRCDRFVSCIVRSATRSLERLLGA